MCRKVNSRSLMSIRHFGITLSVYKNSNDNISSSSTTLMADKNKYKTD